MRSPSSLISSSSTEKKKAAASGLKRGPWTAEEDELLSEYIRREGEGRWRTLPKKAGLMRCGKSCRLRWMNYLRPTVKRGHISDDEEDLILRLHRLLGNRWSLIAGRIPGRTDNEIKNYWNTHLSKKLISQGIDPKTHKPISPLLIPNINPQPNLITTTTINDHHHQFLECSKLLKALPFNSSSTIHDLVPQINHHNPPKSANIFQNNPYNFHDHNEDGFKKQSNDHNLNIISANCSSTMDGDGGADDDDHGTITTNCDADQAFSSFLNSLINDDLFNLNHVRLEPHVQELQEPNLMINFNHIPSWVPFDNVDDRLQAHDPNHALN